MIAIDICNTKNLFEKVTHVLTNIPFTVTKLALFCFKPPRFQEVKEANGLCSEVFQDIHQLFALQKQRTEPKEPNFPGFLLSCITAVLEFTNPTELEHKKRMAEIKEPRILLGQKGLGTKWAGFLRRCLKVVNLETSKKSLPTTQNWEVLYITNGSVKIIEQKSQKVEVVFRIGAVTFSGSGCVYESSCAVVSPVEGWFSKKTGSENGHDIFTLSNCQIVTLTWICTSASLGIRTKKTCWDPRSSLGGWWWRGGFMSNTMNQMTFCLDLWAKRSSDQLRISSSVKIWSYKSVMENLPEIYPQTSEATLGLREITLGDLRNKKPARGLQNWLRNRSLSQNLKMQAAEDVQMGWNKWEDVWLQPNKSWVYTYFVESTQKAKGFFRKCRRHWIQDLFPTYLQMTYFCFFTFGGWRVDKGPHAG